MLTEDVFHRYASSADYMSIDDLLLFLEAEQGVSMCWVIDSLR